jgi:hypothetical protein
LTRATNQKPFVKKPSTWRDPHHRAGESVPFDNVEMAAGQRHVAAHCGSVHSNEAQIDFRVSLHICASLDYAGEVWADIAGASAFARISSEGRLYFGRGQIPASDLGEHRQTCVLGLGQNLYTDFAPSHSSQTWTLSDLTLFHHRDETN